MQVNGYAETNFKDTEIGSIPADWELAKLRDVVEFTHKPRNLNISQFEVIPFIPMDLIPDEGVYAEQYLLKSPQEISSGSYCEDGDLLVAKITPSFENGKQGIVGKLPLKFGYATTEVFAIQPIPERLDKLFLFDFLKQSVVRTDIAGRMEGTTGRQRVPKAVLENYLLPLPPLPEQRRITAVLNVIQDEIAVQDDIIAEAREFKRSLMQRLFTYGVGAEPAETKETEIGEIPAHWETQTIGALCDESDGFVQTGPFGSQLHAADYVDIGIPSVMPQDIIDNQIVTTNIAYVSADDHRRLARYHLQVGDIVYARRGDIGRRAIVTEHENGWLCGTGSLFIRLNNPRLRPLYLHHYLGRTEITAFITARAVGSTMLNLNTKILRAVPVAYPIVFEQEIISDMLSAEDNKIAVEEDRRTALQDFFKTMLHQLMTGQIRLISDEGLPL